MSLGAVGDSAPDHYRCQDRKQNGTMAIWQGAILIPYDSIGEKIGAIAKDKTRRIYVYCRSGRRAQIAKENLEQLGYTDVVNLGSLEDAAKTLNRKIVK